MLMLQVAEPAGTPAPETGGCAKPGAPQPLWVKYCSRQAVILDLARQGASAAREVQQVSTTQTYLQCSSCVVSRGMHWQLVHISLHASGCLAY